jgi:hypothetical protein
MSDTDVIDLTKKRNRIILAVDILLGTILFSECWPTEPVSSYVWRVQRTRWIRFIDRIFGAGHCKESFDHSSAHLFDAPVYRPR